MTAGMVRAEDLANRLEAMARSLRKELADLPAKLAPDDGALRQRLAAEIEASLARIDARVLAKARELRHVQGHG